MVARIAVLLSGGGSNLQALLDARLDARLAADVVAVVSNRLDAYGLRRASDHGIPAVVVELGADELRADYDARLADVVEAYNPDWIVLAGWMRLLTSSFLDRFPGRVVNLHPALPGELPGTHAIERAWNEAHDGKRDHSGVMIHLVPDEGVDDGPVLATATVPIDPSGTLEAFENAVHATEHRLLVDTIIELCNGTLVPTPDTT